MNHDQRRSPAVNRPSFELKVGKEEFKKDRENGLLGIGVTRTMGLPIECMSATISAGHGLRFGKDDGAVLKLGYDDDLEEAFTGSLDSTVHGMSVLTLNAVGMSAKLLDMRINKVFMSQTAGEIAESLAGEAGVQVERADSGISFPVYIIDDRSSCYEHLLMLARRCGYDVYVNDGGKLVFGKFEGKSKHRFEYGKQVLGARLVEELTTYEGVKTYGESPSSSKGSDTYHWLTKDEVLGSAGGERVLIKTDYALKSRESAEEAAKAQLGAREYRRHLELEIAGDPKVRIGDAAEVDGFEKDEVNGKYEIIEVRHTLDKRTGFRSRVGCRRGPE